MDYLNDDTIEFTNPEEFMQFITARKREADDEELLKYEIEETRGNMTSALSSGGYETAFQAAIRLKSICYNKFMAEIEACIKACADSGNISALIYLMERFVARGLSMITADEFRYLTNLYELGYIKSIPLLGDCYRLGIQCACDDKTAERLYFEGAVFGDDKKCLKQLIELYKESEHQTDGWNRTMKLLTLDNWLRDEALGAIGVMMFDGKIKGFGPSEAYVVLHKGDWFDGAALARAGECLLYGYGTERNLVAAKGTLEEACFYLKWDIENNKDEQMVWLEDSLYDYQDYIDTYELAKRNLEVAKNNLNGMSGEDYDRQYGNVTEDDIYEEWREKKPEFVKWSRKKTEGAV